MNSIDLGTELKLVKRSMKLMGNQFEITIGNKEESEAEDLIALAVEEIRSIEKRLTSFSDTSETHLINSHAGIKPVAVSSETIALIKRANRISEITQGAFDLSYGSIDKRLWNFDKTMTSLPDEQTARQMVQLINYRNIVIDDQNTTVFLKEKGMRIGFGGIGKGYAAEKAKTLLKKMGVDSGIVNASGDLSTWGTQPDGKPWTVGIAHPDHRHYAFSHINISDMAIATSGNYEKYVIIGGKKYSHTIDPRTGLPVSGIKSVSIICPNAELADAMATPVTIMGIEAGINMINQLKGMACIIIDDNNNMYTSQNINLK